MSNRRHNEDIGPILLNAALSFYLIEEELKSKNGIQRRAERRAREKKPREATEKATREREEREAIEKA